MQIKDAVYTISEEFADKIEAIKANTPHDELEMVYVGGSAGLDWKSIMAVYAVKTAEDTDEPVVVLVMDEENLDRLRAVVDDMNTVSFQTRTEERERKVVTTDPDTGEETVTTTTFTVTVLTITVIKKPAEEMAYTYRFSQSQMATFAEMLSPDYDTLWEEMLGAAKGAGGYGTPSGSFTPKGIFTWPLGQAGLITSYFGWRDDPFTGEPAYHEGLDLGVAEGTPILAAADGTVTVANSIDSYGGSWGYYIRISHTGGYETLYAHCSQLAVSEGDSVVRGQIIAYVGQTGRATASHLHWEVYLNGTRTDPLSYFE